MTSTRARAVPARLAWSVVWLLILVVLVFVVIRVLSDVSDLSSGRVPPEGEFDRRYVLNPVLAYLHIVPGLVYLAGAPFQLSARLRGRSLDRHRRRGRVVLTAGLLTGVFAVAVGLVMPFGGVVEASAAVVFGTWFLACLLLAYRAIRSGLVSRHRRWMIRAFAVGISVGMIRIVVGVGEAFGIGMDRSFGAAFWIAFLLLAVVAEVWLAVRPDRRS